MNGLNIYFSDFFNVDEDIIESYGAVNISLIERGVRTKTWTPTGFERS